MTETTVLTLLVTANVGSIFEDPTNMLELWTREFLNVVSKLEPKFIALHCQEVGGKNYEKSMEHVEKFVELLMSSSELEPYDKVHLFIDEDYSSAEHFTALGNFYFIHNSLQDVQIWDFKNSEFYPAHGKQIHSGNIEAVSTKEKAKFPQDFFPECKWSRKGFLRTRWWVNGSVFDLVNIHLFHDASNFIAMEQFPSVYSENRRRALKYTLKRFHNDKYGVAPFFIFGDFNFRTDTANVVKKLTHGLTSNKVNNKLKFTDDNNEAILTVGQKEFTHVQHENVFLNTEDNQWLKQLDREMESFDDELHEYPILFPPSYPFSESVSSPTSYMHTRCPSWCDRILLSKTAKDLVNDHTQINYGLIGSSTCMGDHKPVYLTVDLLTQKGTIRCCAHDYKTNLNYVLCPNSCACCDKYASITINITDYSEFDAKFANIDQIDTCQKVDPAFLHERSAFPKKEQLTHDPYTPESAESHSPISDMLEKIIQDCNDSEKNKQQPVSPSLLKSRLENILRRSPSLLKLRTSNSSGDSCYYERSRCNSEVLRTNRPMKNQHRSRIRLKSTTSLNAAFITSRFEGHHSSSEEEWYEEVSLSDEEAIEFAKREKENTKLLLGYLNVEKNRDSVSKDSAVFLSSNNEPDEQGNSGALSVSLDNTPSDVSGRNFSSDISETIEVAEGRLSNQCDDKCLHKNGVCSQNIDCSQSNNDKADDSLLADNDSKKQVVIESNETSKNKSCCHIS